MSVQKMWGLKCKTDDLTAFKYYYKNATLNHHSNFEYFVESNWYQLQDQ